MKLLLDTHIWIWALIEPERLSRRVKRELEDADNELWLSPISVWETLLLVERGRVRLQSPARDWVEAVTHSFPVRDAALSRQVAIESRQVGLAVDDPADRFIAASAMVYGLTLVTSDAQLLQSKSLRTLPNTRR